MKTYTLLVQCDEYGYIEIDANSEEEARELFDSGEVSFYEEAEKGNARFKGGGWTIEKVVDAVPSKK